MRAADTFKSMEPDHPFVEADAQLPGRQLSLQDALRQPQIAIQKSADADQQDGSTKYRANTRN